MISVLTPELSTLRTKVGISQEELANIIGVSRQTYGAIERGTQKLSWNIYLTLILFYDYNTKTHQMMHALSLFPEELFIRLNAGKQSLKLDIKTVFGSDEQFIIEHLDEQALNSIKTMIMVEYARCTGLSGDAVIKSFAGITFSKQVITEKDAVVAGAIKSIKERQRSESK